MSPQQPQQPTTMLEALITPSTTLSLHRVPLPTPSSHEVLIHIAVTGSNPKDWKRPVWSGETQNSGDDMSGTIVSTGSSVSHLFHPGQRVAALHRLGAPHGTYAEYALAPASTVIRLPPDTTFEEAATIPLAALTAATGLFLRLGLPMTAMGGDAGPMEPPAHGTATERELRFRGDGQGEESRKESLVIYGGASAVGAFAIQLAKAAKVGPLIVVAGKGIPFVQSLLGPEDVVVDYRDDKDGSGDSIVAAIERALGGDGPRKVTRAFDCITGHGSYTHLGRVLAPYRGEEQGAGKGGGSSSSSSSTRSKLVTVHRAGMQPDGVFKGVPDDVQLSESAVMDLSERYPAFATAVTALLEVGLRDGWLRPHPHEVVPGGLRGVEVGLRRLREGGTSAVKFVYRVGETEGI